jgi:MFS family permease
VLQRRVLLAGSIVSLVVGAIVLGMSSYVPTFTQEVLGTSALVAGFALAALTVGWPITASLAGHLYLRIGFRATSLIGAMIAAAGAALTLLLGAGSEVWQVALFCFIMGAGMGLVAAPTLIAAQSSVDWGDRGVVTGTNMFARSIGSAFGVAVFGAIVNANTVDGPNGAPPAAQLAPAVHLVFLTVTALAIAMIIAVAFLPGHGATQTAATRRGNTPAALRQERRSG